MRYVVSASEMKAADKKTIEETGLSAEILIEHAASSVYGKLEASEDLRCADVLIFCGTGNNGADGLALGRMLQDGGAEVTCVLVGNREKASKENIFELNIAKKKKINVLSFEDYLKIGHEDRCHDLVIDALLGVGLNRDVSMDYAAAITEAYSCMGKKIALDIPSGISSDDGRVLGIAFRADITYTFSFMKRGLLFYPGRDYAGEVVLCACGIGADALPEGFGVVQLEDEDMYHCLPKRRPDSHKGTYGKVLVVAGGPGITGAAAFCAEAAYRAGAGLVKILTRQENLAPLQSIIPEALFQGYSDTPDIEAIKEAVTWSDVVLIGPGLGKSDTAKNILKTVLQFSPALMPMVIDADALNIIAEDPSLLVGLGTQTVLTPHLLEMSRLSGVKIGEIEDDMINFAASFADKYRVTLALKSAVSVIAEPGGKVFVNTTGNDALSKGGSGDILSGFIAGLLTGGGKPAVAAAAAAYLCGKNAELLTEKMSGRAVMARDLLKEIGEVLSFYGK